MHDEKMMQQREEEVQEEPKKSGGSEGETQGTLTKGTWPEFRRNGMS